MFKTFLILIPSAIVFFIVSESFVSKYPNTWYSKWWRKNVVSECPECD